MELPKAYDFSSHEPEIYKKWIDSGFFSPERLPKREVPSEPATRGDNLPPSDLRLVTSDSKSAKRFSMVLPPPNVTGTLHMGHAAMLAVQDILARYHRMRGDKTLWLPGTDHAAIATQSKVEKELVKREKKNRHDLGREEFLRRVEDFAQQSHDTIKHQIERLGASLDWSREAFTLDEPRSLAVREAFKRMYDAGLIYRGHRIVNWDPKGQTTISDDEIVYEERKDKFYYFKYGPFTIGTARPETKFGDKYVVMHPGDKRYAEYQHGQKLTVEWINGPIEAMIIKDPIADPEFGTGVMTITPWHSAEDFALAEKHGLEKEQIIDKYGKLLPIAQEFAGMKITEAREKIVEKLKEKGLLVKIDDDYIHNVATAERTGGTVEPQVMLQWFVNVNKPFTVANSKINGIDSGSETTLKELMTKVVESGQITITPDRFNAVYFNWINNLRDWCISRQIWYGHRIPVWYKGEEIYVGTEAPTGDGWDQDPDTLDTWFSSGLWTFSTLGWPNETEDLKTYHPTSVLETGYDILFFWVAKMILMTGFLLGDIPFKQVYLHGLVRDEKGKKMSKSLGNIIDPLDMADKYGADATRLSLIIGAAAGNDMKLSEDKVRGYKNFANKIWNISRFILMNLEDFDAETAQFTESEDKTAVAEFEKAKAEATAQIEEFKFYLAAEGMYHYVWHTFADRVIEEAKPRLGSTGSPQDADPAKRASAQAMLNYILRGSLKALHPFMPFVTEAIWSKLPGNENKLLLVEPWE